MKKQLQKAALCSAISLLSSSVLALPNAPSGYKWQVVDALTDEFNDTTINENKWFKFNTTWSGRDPGRFKQSQVSESGGFLRLQNKKVADTSAQVWIHTGFLSSKTESFTSGMYSEARLKAAKDGTVTGFWMSAPGHTEIDVQEAVGFSPNGNQRLVNLMRMNTHYHPNGWDTDKITPEDHEVSAVGDNFHTYGVWWKDTRNLSYYHNGAWVTNVYTGGEFDRGMKININTETQNWLGDPIVWRLNNNDLNYSLVDYVRTWKLVPDNGSTPDEAQIPYSDTGTTISKESKTWSTGKINTGGKAVSVSLKAVGTGSMETADYLNIYYKLDGGNKIALLQKTDSFVQATINKTNLVANTIEIIIEGKTSAANEVYTVNNLSVSATPAVGGESVHLTKRNASSFAIDGNVGAANSQNVYLWEENPGNINQNWIEISHGEGYYSYKKADTNFCLDGRNGGANGQNVHLWSCNSENFNQHWLKVNLGGGNFRLQKRNAPGYSIDGGNGGDNLQNVYLWASDDDNQNQHWNFAPGTH
ncbi:RICIN domain-containing protein [Agaribacterium sp. ZY112]|uniref:RICIN domain-containing protein n=1 Tax=Agaribacterium sp. ZY112 TaxID=3233574 RepID=UPI0035259329